MNGNLTCKTILFGDRVFDVVGYYDDDTPEGQYERFDVFEVLPEGDSPCLNEGEPMYTDQGLPPSNKEVLLFLKDLNELQKAEAS